MVINEWINSVPLKKAVIACLKEPLKKINTRSLLVAS